MIFPAEFKAGFAQGIVAQLGAGVALGQVCCVGGNFIGDNAGFYVIFIGQPQVFFGGDVAQHRTAIPTDLGRADTRSDMVVARRNIRGQRP